MHTNRFDQYGQPIFICPLCGEDHEGFNRRRGQMARYGIAAETPASFVCSLCAEIIENLSAIAHGGAPTSWTNLDKPSGYQKKPIPEALRWQVFERDGMKCKKCGSQSWLRADHIVPEIAGGEATLDNLQTLCRSCNSKKGKRAA